jgi:transcription termination factor NusB
MEEETIGVMKDEVIAAILEVGLDPDVIKQKAKSYVGEAFRKKEINGHTIRLIGKIVMLGSLDAAKETGSDPAFVGKYTATGILEEIREFNEKSYAYVTDAQQGMKEAIRMAIDSWEEEELAGSLRVLLGMTNSL